MALDDLKQVYQAVLLDYAASTKYRQPLANPAKEVSLVNESCGDRLTLQVDLAGGKISRIACQAQGCAISQASATILASLAVQQPQAVLDRLQAAFWRMLEGQEISKEEEE
ncbi:iron-sulfur cluster assembly scaffold protein, partial [Lactobacillus nasalidis]